MSLFDRIKAYFWLQSSEEEKLAKLMIKNNKIPMWRTHEYELIMSKIREAARIDPNKPPDELVDNIIDYANDVDKAINLLVIPWNAAGSEQWYAKVILAWQEIYVRTLDIANTVKEIMQYADNASENDMVLKMHENIVNANSREELKRELAQNLHYFFTTFYLKYAKFVVAISWYHENMLTK